MSETLVPKFPRHHGLFCVLQAVRGAGNALQDPPGDGARSGRRALPQDHDRGTHVGAAGQASGGTAGVGHTAPGESFIILHDFTYIPALC